MIEEICIYNIVTNAKVMFTQNGGIGKWRQVLVIIVLIVVDDSRQNAQRSCADAHVVFGNLDGNLGIGDEL